MNQYKAYVIGYLWWPNGMQHANEYRFLAENDEIAEQKIDRIAGDFSQVTDFELHRREYCTHCGGTIWECVKRFSEEGALTYLECIA